MVANLWELEARTNDGSGNNAANPTWGQAGTILLRDFVGAPTGETAPLYANGDGVTPRVYPVAAGKLSDLATYPTAPIDFIDETVRTEANIPNSFGTNELSAFYGQFITHDMTASAIPVPIPGIPGLFPNALSNGTPDDDLLGLINRTPAALNGDGELEQLNGVTHTLDLSGVYGSGTVIPTTTGTTTVNDALRVQSGSVVDQAKLLTNTNGGLPTFADVLTANPDAIAAAWGPAFGNFTGNPGQVVAGDARAAQQPFLAAIQAVWLKEHNYQVDQLAAKYAGEIASGAITSDDLFNMARAITEAEHQHIIYQEYLAAIIGEANVPEFTGYDETVNPGVRNLFTTVAFRFGHDQQSETVPLLNADGSAAADPLNLAQAFLLTSSQLQKAGGLEEVLRGLQVQKSQEIDGKLVPSLIDNVLNIPGLNLNLGLLDNVRAADHGIGTLNQVREQLGLAKYTSFAQLTSDAAVQAKLAEYYGHIDNVDPWIGGLLEKAVPGSQLGQTFQAIVIEQFQATMAGDRFYFEEHLKDFPELIAEIKGVTFAEITDRNSDTGHSHLDSFHVAYRMELTSGRDTKYGADNASYLKADLMIGKGGHDALYGRDGDDTLYGDDGNDQLDGGNGNDFLKCGTGNDTAYGGTGNDHAWGEDGDDYIALQAGDDWADGGKGDDFVNCGDGNDIALGKEGNDEIFGENGNDELFGGAGKDDVSGGGGNDRCYGGADNDVVGGESGNDTLFGGAGNDIVNGGLGNDWIAGETGNDELCGGSGYDAFAFGVGSGKDTITDFNVKQDTIDLSELDLEWGEITITTKRGTTTIDLGDTDSDGYHDTIALVGISSTKYLSDAIVFHHDDPLVA